ncbi:MAG: hypothetical protein ACJ74Z_07835 [Bryobacteraceae bacterium]
MRCFFLLLSNLPFHLGSLAALQQTRRAAAENAEKLSPVVIGEVADIQSGD